MRFLAFHACHNQVSRNDVFDRKITLLSNRFSIPFFAQGPHGNALVTSSAQSKPRHILDFRRLIVPSDFGGHTGFAAETNSEADFQSAC
jgi:hypothetical protein